MIQLDLKHTLCCEIFTALSVSTALAATYPVVIDKDADTRINWAAKELSKYLLVSAYSHTASTKTGAVTITGPIRPEGRRGESGANKLLIFVFVIYFSPALLWSPTRRLFQTLVTSTSSLLGPLRTNSAISSR